MPTLTHLDRTSILGSCRSAGGFAASGVTDLKRRKTKGIHYTPPLLAAYLAGQVVNALKGARAKSDQLSILDPACGEGELLKAVVDAVPSAWRAKLHIAGFDTDEAALERAHHFLEDAGVASVELRSDDFLSCVTGIETSAQLDLLRAAAQPEGLRLGARFDAIISNPPYVRTQVLGSAAARGLAVRFNLTGRVDLYHAFVKAMTLVLREGGILGLLTSNRFLTVQSGSSMRDLLHRHFRLRRLVDLGDTKLFEAAVLPAIVVAERAASTDTQDCEFIRVYEASGMEIPSTRQTRSILDVLDGSFAGQARANGTCFHVETGRLQTGLDSRTPWAMSNVGVDAWLAVAKSNSAVTFGDVAKICVGIKTTADSVFIRDDWETLPEPERPENELLHPLVTHRLAVRWQLPTDAVSSRRVLYPYVSNATDRLPVDLADFPRARAYLLKHRARLERRSYVIDSGRQWYEVWVPHRPSDWTQPKVAFPDISETNKFFLVEPGWIVNGDCYWTKLLPGKDISWLMLMLAVANSSFALEFYDAVFHNKLYSGRRRFMSQYVSRFPLPKLKRALDILDVVPSVIAASRVGTRPEVERLERDLDELVWKAFGLTKEVAR
jgi:adenine-specific DNA-methyltransferase